MKRGENSFMGEISYVLIKLVYTVSKVMGLGNRAMKLPPANHSGGFHHTVTKTATSAFMLITVPASFIYLSLYK
jgi:hypothetical protein